MKKIETSKKIVVAMMVVFVLALGASYTLTVMCDGVRESVWRIFQAVSTLTGTVLVGYFGKAGFENYDKHKKPLEGGDK